MQKILINIIVIIAFSLSQSKANVVIDTLPFNLTETNLKFQKLFEDAKKGDSDAMLDLSRCYLTGSYVKQDIKIAYSWAEKSAQLGNSSAWVELANYYKYGTGRQINFIKAYEYISKSAEMGNIEGVLFQGYMQYKGFGCKQDYESAFAAFRRANLLDQPYAAYLLGVCYRNGFGTSKDEIKAKAFFKKAMDLKFVPAFDELQKPKPEYNPTNSFLIQNLPKIKDWSAKSGVNVENYNTTQTGKPVTTQQLAGDYTGYFVKYDWSGTKILEISPLIISFNTKDSLINGFCLEHNRNDSLIFKAVSKNNKIIFDKTYYRRLDYYHSKPPVYQFTDTDMSIIVKNGLTFLVGNIAINNVIEREPYNPVTLILLKNNAIYDTKVTKQSTLSNSIKNPNSIESLQEQELSINVFPNPYSDYVNVFFNLLHQGNVQIKIFDVTGKIVFSTVFTNLSEGEHTKELSLGKLTSGNYVLSVETNNISEQVKITKP